MNSGNVETDDSMIDSFFLSTKIAFDYKIVKEYQKLGCSLLYFESDPVYSAWLRNFLLICFLINRAECSQNFAEC